MAAKLSELTMNELLVIQRAGIDADNFVKANEFYVRHLKPAILRDIERSKYDGDWKPNKSTDATTILLFNSYNSGKVDGINDIESVCKRIVFRGVDATKEIERRKKIGDKNK